MEILPQQFEAELAKYKQVRSSDWTRLRKKKTEPVASANAGGSLKTQPASAARKPQQTSSSSPEEAASTTPPLDESSLSATQAFWLNLKSYLVTHGVSKSDADKVAVAMERLRKEHQRQPVVAKKQ